MLQGVHAENEEARHMFLGLLRHIRSCVEGVHLSWDLRVPLEYQDSRERWSWREKGNERERKGGERVRERKRDFDFFLIF